MVARITDAVTGEPLSLHFTQLHPDGKRVKKYLSAHLKKGGVVRLFGHTGALCVAEGIETALAASYWEGPTWAALDAGNLANLPLVPGVESLTVFPDNDPPGLNAARQCAARWMSAEVPVQLVRWHDGTPRGWDACDELGARNGV